VLVTGAVVFAGASTNGGIAHSSSQRIGARFTQRLGAAMLSAAALSGLTLAENGVASLLWFVVDGG
jgi:hypothetical protein